MEILFDEKGTPLMFRSSRVFGYTETPSPVVEKPKETFTIGKREFVSWGPGNHYPDDAVRTIGSTGVLSTGIGFKARTSFGQGVVPMDIKGYDDEGEMILTGCKDAEVQKYFRSWQFINYASSAFRDLFKFGNCFPILYFNHDGSRIVNVIIHNARHCRVSKDKKYLLTFPNFDELQPIEKDCEMFQMLDEYDPFLDLERLRVMGKLKGQPVAFPRIKNYYSNNDYYGIPDWDADRVWVYKAGHFSGDHDFYRHPHRRRSWHGDGTWHPLPECSSVYHDTDRNVPYQRNLFSDQQRIHRDPERYDRCAGVVQDLYQMVERGWRMGKDQADLLYQL